MSNSLWPHGLQYNRLPHPSPTPGVYPNSCPSSRWCHPTISSSAIPFSSCLQSSPASGSFQMSQFFASGGQRIRASASTSILPMNIQDWFPLGWTGWISLQSKGLSSLLQHHSSKASLQISPWFSHPSSELHFSHWVKFYNSVQRFWCHDLLSGKSLSGDLRFPFCLRDMWDSLVLQRSSAPNVGGAGLTPA